MILIPLEASTEFALVDDEDYPALAGRTWYLENGAAVSHADVNHRRWLSMHIMLMGRRPGYYIDHIDGNRANNQRANLRWVTPQQNMWNRAKTSRPKTSRFKGVARNKRGRWTAQIQCDYLGSYDREEDAAKAYDREARERYGLEYALCNFPLAGAPLSALRTVAR